MVWSKSQPLKARGGRAASSIPAKSGEEGLKEDIGDFFSDLLGHPKNSSSTRNPDQREGTRYEKQAPSLREEDDAYNSPEVGETVSNQLASTLGSQQTQDSVPWLELGLCKSLIRAVTHLGFLAPTPVQVEAIPAALRGKDVCARSVTGSGKTAAFLLPLAHTLLTRAPRKAAGLRSSRRYIRSVILLPTRELGVQCETMLRQLLQFSTGLSVAVAIGGVAPAAQEAALDAAPDILIATPGRLVDYVHNFRGVGLDLSGVEIVVLDECDKMLTVTMMAEVLDVLHSIPEETRQVLLFSATMTKEVDAFADDHLFEPHNVDIGHVALQSKLKQQFVRIVLSSEDESGEDEEKGENKEKKPRIRSKRLREEERLASEPSKPRSSGEIEQHKVTMVKTRNLVALCKNFFKEKTIVFCKYRSTVHRLALLFQELKLSVVEIQGQQEQENRFEALQKFSDGEAQYLITTDVASRGLDIPSVKVVVNYDLPPTLTAYIHRVGRTARVGASGVAVSLVDENHDGEIMRKILAISGVVNDCQVATVKRRDIPKEMLAAAKNEVDAAFPSVKMQLEAEELEERIKAAEKRYGKSNTFSDSITEKPQKAWILSKMEQRDREKAAKDAYEKESEITINRFQNILSNLEREEMKTLQAQKQARRSERQKKQMQKDKEKAKRAELRKKAMKVVERNVVKKLKKKNLRAAAKERRATDREKKGLKPYVRRERTKKTVKNRRRSKMKKH